MPGMQQQRCKTTNHFISNDHLQQKLIQKHGLLRPACQVCPKFFLGKLKPLLKPYQWFAVANLLDPHLIPSDLGPNPLYNVDLCNECVSGKEGEFCRAKYCNSNQDIIVVNVWVRVSFFNKGKSFFWGLPFSFL
jgi:hypothetical protein